MAEDIDEFWLVEWLRDLFADASAESMYRWVLVAWLVAVGGLIALDRIGSMLQGRSRPRVQTPPGLARLWRWRRFEAPATYSALPAGTVIDSGSTRALPASIPLARSTPIEDAELVVLEQEHRQPATPLEPPDALMLPAGPIANDRFWRLAADSEEPIYGLENNIRLELGRAPERYNPITDSIETLERDPTTGIASWPRPAGAKWHGIGLGLDEPDESEPDGADPDDVDGQPDPDVMVPDAAWVEDR